MIYFIADTHFGHKNIIKYENRPFADIPSMDEGLIANWNAVVKSEDIVYMLGDFTLSHNFENCRDLCARLNGHKVLIRGNHDSLTREKYLAAGFEQVFPNPIALENSIDGHRLILSHYPPHPENMEGYNYYLFGHVHGKWCPAEEKENAICVSCERIEYKPISMDEVGEALRQKAAGLYKKVEKPDFIYENDALD
jgi:calcineurin-like phosphoesterase family protein